MAREVRVVLIRLVVTVPGEQAVEGTARVVAGAVQAELTGPLEQFVQGCLPWFGSVMRVARNDGGLIADKV